MQLCPIVCYGAKMCYHSLTFTWKYSTIFTQNLKISSTHQNIRAKFSSLAKKWCTDARWSMLAQNCKWNHCTITLLDKHGSACSGNEEIKKYGRHFGQTPMVNTATHARFSGSMLKLDLEQREISQLTLKTKMQVLVGNKSYWGWWARSSSHDSRVSMY